MDSHAPQKGQGSEPAVSDKQRRAVHRRVGVVAAEVTETERGPCQDSQGQKQGEVLFQHLLRAVMGKEEIAREKDDAVQPEAVNHHHRRIEDLRPRPHDRCHRQRGKEE